MGFIGGSWADWDNPPPPNFVDRTWLYTTLWFLGFHSVALGIALLHTRQFRFSLLRAVAGVWLETGVALFSVTIFGALLPARFLRIMPMKLWNSGEYLWFITGTFGLAWLIGLIDRPTLLRLWGEWSRGAAKTRRQQRPLDS